MLALFTRLLLAATLIYFSYHETGPFTASIFCLLALAYEAQATALRIHLGLIEISLNKKDGKQ